ncbi:hypothetical protein ERO13_D13G127600v2 [Gossypium hirsutum]|uniref:Uncharacterized protein n=3 Tax=Gossypium TaxID=3633 RepID=A0A5J5NMG9_GOSBA|nr:hypothetical protein ES319_D13G145200v1 [Gossypium barbadense]KAG4111855.1 hypothetical protein ERO13_D13G127600v2 [Gossypium hirsutum]TYG37610.1 hypothetical protein ES288_D13G154900v1 [Gossypium darwinii]TYH34874.1 hypothetical protein ES332_D13G155000v1 [Gossypium tomentosum]
MCRSSPSTPPFQSSPISDHETTKRGCLSTNLTMVWALENVGCARATCCNRGDNRWRKNVCGTGEATCCCSTNAKRVP